MDKLSAIGFFFILLLASIPIFYNLAGPSIFIWDEAIYANNALEMAMNGDPLVLKNNGEISLYNTKPPLVIWLQCLAIKILGPTEWAIRLPSAVAALLTVLLLLLFARHSLKDQRIGIVAVLVLVTTQGYIRNHIVRSGDLDAVLIFWIVFYSLLTFHYLLQKPENYKKYFTWIGLGILAAFFSKSVAGLMPLLGLALAALFQKQLLAILKKPYSYVVLLSVATLCVGYYVLRENLAPGYLEKVIHSEYRRMTENIMPWHEHPFWYYAQNMWQRDFFTPYVFLLPLALVLGLWQPGKTRDFTLMTLVFCSSYFLLISYPSVKLEWYAASLYPFLSLLLGLTLVKILDGVGERLQWMENRRQVLFYGSLLLLFCWPYKNIITSIQNTLPVDPFEKEGYSIRHLQRTQPELKNYQVLMTVPYREHLDQANFYIKAANHFDGKQIGLVNDWKELEKGNTVLCCQSENIDSLQEQFDLIEKSKNELIEVIGCRLIELN